jgi:glycosyltransferase involved in cell wall biosynthesis
MKLGVVYHMPFWRNADGQLVEPEGSFARYVETLAPYFTEVSVCAPERPAPGGAGTPIRAANVTLAALPYFDGPRQFYPQLPSILGRLARWTDKIDLLHCRVPTPAAFFAYLFAKRRHLPVFLLVVGDLEALRPTLPYRGVKRGLYRAYTEWEEFGLRTMTRGAVTFANGAALARKHTAPGVEVLETTTTTLTAADIADRVDTCAGSPLRILTVSRIDPRKGLRVLPAVVRRLLDAGRDVVLDVIGPPVGRPGEAEREAIVADANRLGVGGRVRLLGSVPLERLLPRYREYDVFVLPTLPGEGIPRVLLESMASGVPVVVSGVAGIPSLLRHEDNGLLLEDVEPDTIAAAVERIFADGPLRRSLIASGNRTARARTLDGQVAWMIDQLGRRLQIAIRSASEVA